MSNPIDGVLGLRGLPAQLSWQLDSSNWKQHSSADYLRELISRKLVIIRKLSSVGPPWTPEGSNLLLSHVGARSLEGLPVQFAQLF